MEEGSASSFCCLCRRLFNASALKKRKRLHGEEIKKLLDDIVSERLALSLSSYVETQDTAAAFYAIYVIAKLRGF